MPATAEHQDIAARFEALLQTKPGQFLPIAKICAALGRQLRRYEYAARSNSARVRLSTQRDLSLIRVNRRWRPVHNEVGPFLAEPSSPRFTSSGSRESRVVLYADAVQARNVASGSGRKLRCLGHGRDPVRLRSTM
jgi:hypothetical protein